MPQKQAMTLEMKKLCREGFPDEAYSAIETKTYLTTLKAFYVTERLNDVFGMGRWTINVEVLERTPDYVLMQGEFISEDYDVNVPKQFGGHTTTGKGTEIADGYKSAFTDCQSKIASYFEIGADMFKGKIKRYAKPKKAYSKPAAKTTPAPQKPATIAPRRITDKEVTEAAMGLNQQDKPDKATWEKYFKKFVEDQHIINLRDILNNKIPVL